MNNEKFYEILSYIQDELANMEETDSIVTLYEEIEKIKEEV